MLQTLRKALFALAALALLAGCNLGYGEVGGADTYVTYAPGAPVFKELLAQLSGVWYSHYGAARSDGYRIGLWQDFDTEMGAKLDLFSFPDTAVYKTCTGGAPKDGDFYVFYDDTVYGQDDSGEGGNGGWTDLVTRYVGIVRAVNVFNGDRNRGALIIEYLAGACPTWDDALKDGSHPFFGVFYKVIDDDRVQMANAVDLSALYEGKPYYTETATFGEAVAKNTPENEAEFISWGVVLPQKRERP
jgi:hypothetical protein